MHNRQITLAARPSGMPKREDFRLVESEIPTPSPRQFLVKMNYFSVDPYMRGLMAGTSSYAGRLKVGDVIPGGAVGTVTKSRNEDFRDGDVVFGNWGWREYALSDGDDAHRVDTSVAPMSTALGVLGMPGMTAYFGLLNIGRPREGDSVFVTGAAGAVGSLVGQIAKLKWCRVAGCAGSDEKVRYLTDELGFDAAFNYHEAGDYASAIREACPSGIDVFYDNVGGPISDAAFAQLNVGARVVVCGQISQYNNTEAPLGPRLLWRLITKQARAEGFLVSQFKEHFGEARREIAGWIRDGKVTWRETVVGGIENTPDAFIGLFEGRNTGKMLVKVAEEG